MADDAGSTGETGDCTMYAGDEIYSDDITTGALPDALEDPYDEDDDEEEEEQDSSVQAPWPTLYVDGTAQEISDGDELERVQVEFDDVANGMLDEKQLRGPLAWCNSASITLDRDEDAVHVGISCGDPRGAFVMTIRRIFGDDGEERLLMHVPHLRDSMLHMPLAEHHEGTYKVGYWSADKPEVTS